LDVRGGAKIDHELARERGLTRAAAAAVPRSAARRRRANLDRLFPASRRERQKKR